MHNYRKGGNWHEAAGTDEITPTDHFIRNSGTPAHPCNYSIRRIQCSAITLKALKGDVNDIDHVVTVASVEGWDILGSK